MNEESAATNLQQYVKICLNRAILRSRYDLMETRLRGGGGGGAMLLLSLNKG